MDVDDTLVLILERIDSHISLVRAASTCRRWRRIIAGAGFLRHHLSLHGPPPVAGHYHNGYPKPDTSGTVRGHTHAPKFFPSSPIDARHFSLDFIVDASIFPSRDDRDNSNSPSWEVLDSRGSLLLMELVHETYIHGVFPDLVVCEPATRRYKVIPPPPRAKNMHRGPFLVDGDEDEEVGGRISMLNFRLLCVLSSRDGGAARTAVFTATDATWREKAINHIMGSRKKMAHPCEFSWPPVLQAALG